MTPALVKLGFTIRIDAASTDPVIENLFGYLIEEFDIQLGRFRRDSYYKLYQEARDTVDRELSQMITNKIDVGDEIPGIKEESGRLSFSIEKIHGIRVTNGETEQNQFEAELLVSTKQVTIVGIIGSKIIYAQGDATNDLRAGNPISLYQIDNTNLSWFEEYQSIKL